MDNIYELITMVVTVLTAIQVVINYFLSPEKAAKFNYIGKLLEALTKTKAGLSPKVEKE